MEQEVDHRTLERYLVDHLLAARTCLGHIEAVRTLIHEPSQAATLRSLYEQVRDDRNDLRAIAGRLHLRESSPPLRWRVAAACGVPRPKQAGALQAELDLVSGLLHSKLAMWNTLMSLAIREPRLDAVQLITLSDRTREQIKSLDRVCQKVRPRLFLQPP